MGGRHYRSMDLDNMALLKTGAPIMNKCSEYYGCQLGRNEFATRTFPTRFGLNFRATGSGFSQGRPLRRPESKMYSLAVAEKTATKIDTDTEKADSNTEYSWYNYYYGSSTMSPMGQFSHLYYDDSPRRAKMPSKRTQEREYRTPRRAMHEETDRELAAAALDYE